MNSQIDHIDMAGEETTSSKGNITNNYNAGQTGLNLDNTLGQIKKGTLTYALNANIENFDSNSVNYQNEEGNVPCVDEDGVLFPDNTIVIGTHFINEQSKHIFFLVNTETGGSEIGQIANNNCIYETIIANDCLNFDINHPVQKAVHRLTNCTTELYWTDGKNPRRYLDIDNPPTTDICNSLNIQPNFPVPELTIVDVVTGGELIAGTYQFAIQYCDAVGFGYTSYYSVTNPVSIGNVQVETLEFNYPVNRSIVVNITNLDEAGHFEYYNLAVIKTINGIASVELVGTYNIDAATNQVTYSGQNQTQIRLAIEDIFEKFPYYDIAQDVTAVQDILVWDQLTSNERVSYQSIAANIDLKWQTYRIPAGETYANELNSANLRGYLRDEVYAFEIVFLLKNGKQTDGFHIPGRTSTSNDTTPIYKNANADYIGTGDVSPRWKIYNTASVTGNASYVNDNINNASAYKYGEFAYWESQDEEYPNNSVFTDAGLTGPIRHHKFPDVLVSPIFESTSYTTSLPIVPVMSRSGAAVYPLGVLIDVDQVKALIENSEYLTDAQKADISGFKIVRGNRSTNKSIIAKGILRNVGKYQREGTTYYFPNYPYNDLNKDPFLSELNTTDRNSKSYAFNSQSVLYYVSAVFLPGSITITDCNTGDVRDIPLVVGAPTLEVCSLTYPKLNGGASASINNPGSKTICVGLTSDSSTTFKYYNAYTAAIEFVTVTLAQGIVYKLVNSFYPVTYNYGSKNFTITTTDNINPLTLPNQLEGFDTDASKFRMVLNSPETSFGQPSLGNVLKLENVMFGAGIAHFAEVKNNARYKFITRTIQQQALRSSYDLANSVSPFDPNAMFTTYQSYLTIYINGISRRNFSWSFNSVAQYDYWGSIGNSGFKQRELDIYQYAIPGVQSVSDDHDLNNFQRESSIYVKTKLSRPGDLPLPYPNAVPALNNNISDVSRYVASEKNACGAPEDLKDISVVSYYGSLKNIVPNQYGQLYSYQTIDTGYQVDFDNIPTAGLATIFGGDTFISRFAFKTKLPFFIDNRVAAPDDSDVFYDEIGNVAYPRYWHSSRSILSNYTTPNNKNLQNVISIKATALDCPNNPIYSFTSTTTTTTTAIPGSVTTGSLNYGYTGKMYQFAYGIPYFYCESSINVDLRQAFNNREGNFYPHVSSGIPDNWLQQSYVPIVQDNTYYYNVTYSKQNTENNFTHLPFNWSNNQCNVVFPFRAIYSEPQSSDPTVKINNWLIYRPISYFDFPQNYGPLVSLDGIQNKGILARFENKSLLYNTMLTINTSNPQAAYVGNPTLFRSSPPVDFAETDLGYVGTQNKFLLKIPQGQITVDAKRGQIFLISGAQAVDLTAFGSGVNRFMTDHLAFEILRFFPEAEVDNNFSKVGLHGVFDSKYDRVIISKLDYIPQPAWIGEIYYDNTPTLDVTCTGVTWYFNNSGDLGFPDEVFTYMNCDGVESTVIVPVKEVYSKCVQIGTTPPTGSQGDNPFTADEECTVTRTIPNPNYKEYYILVDEVPTVIQLLDPEYFCNKSWTLSFNLNTKSWVSFHSYIPNYYIGENNFFYSGLNQGCNLTAIAAVEVSDCALAGTAVK
jgi:hypothetical protein